jgi:hypothetical protein
METDKSGKAKVTIELELNQPLMELIKQNMEMMNEIMPQLMQNWREGMAAKHKEGQGHMGMMMHHGQE